MFVQRKKVQMPEGPEVKITTEFLDKYLKKGKVVKWDFVGGKYTDEPPDNYDYLDSNFPLQIKSVSCKGKTICFHITTNEKKDIWILHCMMFTGSWGCNYDEYCKWFIELENGDTYWFRDPRSLGTLEIIKDEDYLYERLNNLGFDILNLDMTMYTFKQLCKKHQNKNVTSFLMDQTILSGIGNYLKAEILYDSKIAPVRKMYSLSEIEQEHLFESIMVIPKLSYMHKGMSMRDYKNMDGSLGKFKNLLKIYGKKNAERTKTADGRITYWDPNIQV